MFVCSTWVPEPSQISNFTVAQLFCADRESAQSKLSSERVGTCPEEGGMDTSHYCPENLKDRRRKRRRQQLVPGTMLIKKCLRKK